MVEATNVTTQTPEAKAKQQALLGVLRQGVLQAIGDLQQETVLGVFTINGLSKRTIMKRPRNDEGPFLGFVCGRLPPEVATGLAAHLQGLESTSPGVGEHISMGLKAHSEAGLAVASQETTCPETTTSNTNTPTTHT